MDAFDLTNSLYWVADRRLADGFPPTSSALSEPDGLLAIGGDLSPQRLLSAYRRGIFPWYSDGQPILWWSPDPRAVFAPAEIHISRSLGKTLRKRTFEVTWDCAFVATVDACAAPRAQHSGSWITRPMRDAYIELHRRGIAHSIECWQDGELAGGLYGIAMGCMFFGESMFSRRRDASKVALAVIGPQLAAWGYALIDCQIQNLHLATLGARTIARTEFESILKRMIDVQPAAQAWAPAPPSRLLKKSQVSAVQGEI